MVKKAFASLLRAPAILGNKGMLVVLKRRSPYSRIF